MLLLGSFIFGTIIGSFANVFVLRYGTGRSLNGRSSCPSCSKRLVWYELVPVFSWIIQRGKCRSCGTRISPQYFIVELVFGVVFALCAYQTNNLQPMTGLVIGHWSLVLHLLYLWLVSFFLISLSIYDIRHMIIPDGMLIALSVVVLGWKISEVTQSLTAQLHPDILTSFLSSLHPLVAGPLVALPFFILWFISNGRWMGFGDIKLAVVIGWMLGLLGGFSALIFGVWAGAIVSLMIIGIIRLRQGFGGQARLVSHRTGLTMKSEIPFGPFLAASALFVLLTGITLETVIFYF